MIYFLIIVAIVCLIICYKMTDSIFATVAYGIYEMLIIFAISLLFV